MGVEEKNNIDERNVANDVIFLYYRDGQCSDRLGDPARDFRSHGRRTDERNNFSLYAFTLIRNVYA